MPGEGDVTALLFRRELRILLSFFFGEKIFAAFSRSDVEDLFRGVD